MVTAKLTRTAEEWAEGMRHAAPPTPDDVTILWDGRRIDSKEAAMQWLAEVDELRVTEEVARAAASTGTGA